MALTTGIVGLPNVVNQHYLTQLHKLVQNQQTIHSVRSTRTSEL